MSWAIRCAPSQSPLPSCHSAVSARLNPAGGWVASSAFLKSMIVIPTEHTPAVNGGVSCQPQQEAAAVSADPRTREQLIATIEAGFARTTRPAAPFIQGSREGCEPGESVEPF